jgi:hypothetical protein
MAIAFPYPLSGIGLAPLFQAELLWKWKPFTPLARWLRGPPAKEATPAEAVNTT